MDNTPHGHAQQVSTSAENPRLALESTVVQSQSIVTVPKDPNFPFPPVTSEPWGRYGSFPIWPSALQRAKSRLAPLPTTPHSRRSRLHPTCALDFGARPDIFIFFPSSQKLRVWTPARTRCISGFLAIPPSIHCKGPGLLRFHFPK